MQNFARNARDLSKEVQARVEAEREGEQQERRGAYALATRGVQALAERWQRGR